MLSLWSKGEVSEANSGALKKGLVHYCSLFAFVHFRILLKTQQYRIVIINSQVKCFKYLLKA